MEIGAELEGPGVIGPGVMGPELIEPLMGALGAGIAWAELPLPPGTITTTPESWESY
ncbi:hypothetical protein PSm6_12070 [Pseudomonas solani]|uniref:Uncharacterized protein n=1 Tax=Pseudomonas solani TaxID=2731552 RepID=A0ABM7L5G2_9PSED|nr:hypothetical protein PSm6_12070 [Pseudomonas solani]